MSSNIPKSEVKVLLAIVILPLVFFWRELIGLTVFAGFDFTRLILPFHQFARHAFSHGYLPEWNPFMFAGFPQIAEGEGGFFYPGNWMMLLPGDQGILMSWNIVLHLILTGYLMYMFLRERGTSVAASGWLALIYQFLPGLILRMETVGLFQAACWLPGFFWTLERSMNIAVRSSGSGNACRNGWHMWTLYSTAQIAFMLLAGSSQIAFYAMIGGFLYLCGYSISGPKPWRRAGLAGLTFISIAIFSVVLSSVQLIPTAMFSELSWRVREADYDYFRIGTWLTLPRLSSLFMFPAVSNASDILYYVSSLGYIGILPLILVGIAINRYKKFMNPILAPFFVLFFGLMLSFGLNFFINEDLIEFPGFNLFRAMGRMILPTVIAFFAMAAMGLDQLFQLARDGKYRRECLDGIIATVIITLILLIWLLFFDNDNNPGLFIPGLTILGVLYLVVAGCLIGFFRNPKPVWLVTVLTIWLALHFVILVPLKTSITMNRRAFNGMIQRMESDFLPDEHKLGFITWQKALISYDENVWDPLLGRVGADPIGVSDVLPVPATGNELTLANISVLNAYTPLVTDRWHRVARDYAAKGLDDIDVASDRLRNILALTRTTAVIAPDSFIGGTGFQDLNVDLTGLFPDNWQALMTPDPVEYISVPRYVEAWSETHWDWFKHWVTEPGYVPVETVCVEVDENTILPDGMEWSAPLTPVEDFDPLLPATGGYMLNPDAVCEITAVTRDIYGAPVMYIDVNADQACWVVIRESNMPGWTATVDRNPVQISTADYLFIGVPVPDGSHQIKLVYRTPGLALGGWISSIGWLIFLLTIALTVVIQKKKS